MDSDEDRNRKLYEHYDKMFPSDLAWNATVAVIIMRGTRPGIQGTGTLLKIAEEHFVITAEHVISGSSGNLTILPSDTDKMIPLDGEGIFGENVDIGVVHLSPKQAEKIDPNRFLRLHNFSKKTGDAKTLYAVIGFPELLFNADEPNITKYHQLAHGWDGDPTTLDEFSKLFHFHIGADIDAMIGPDGKPRDFTYPGTPVSAQFPRELKGISGGSVWRIATFRGGRHLVDTPKIVGVECAVFQNARCIRAVRWGAVADMIRSALPNEVGGAFDLWRP